MTFKAEDFTEIASSEPMVISDRHDAIIIKIRTYKDKPSIDIRRYYLGGQGYLPTPKGVSIPIEDVDSPAIDIVKEAQIMLDKFLKGEYDK